MNIAEFTTTEWMIVSLSGTAILCALVSLLLYRIVRRERMINTRNAKLIETMQADIHALCSGAAGIGERVSRIDERLRRTSERQEQLEMHKGADDRTYAQAIRMVQSGSSIQDVMNICDISRGEAELIMMMHNVEKAS